jgi:hypothetical protein
MGVYCKGYVRVMESDWGVFYGKNRAPRIECARSTRTESTEYLERVNMPWMSEHGVPRTGRHEVPSMG